MNYLLIDNDDVRANLLPMTYTRPVSELRVGALTLREKWQRRLSEEYHYRTVDYLSEIFPCGCNPAADDTVSLASDIIPTDEIVAAVVKLAVGESLFDAEGAWIATRGVESVRKTVDFSVRRIARLTDIFMMNGEEIEADFALLTAGRQSADVSQTVAVVGDRSRLFIEPGATVECCAINVTHGPVYIGANAEVMECSALRGPIAICDNSFVNMGSKIYGATTIGPWSKVGGELNNVVIHSYSNKAHDGFLGNAVIGSWCNLGAGCVASNLKNDYTEIKLWNYPSHRFVRTGLQFCGLIMGDHSKAGINTMFNTATVVGVGVNIHGTGFPRNFVASFSEGGTAGFSDVSMTKFFDVAARVMARRGIALTEADRRMFYAIRDAAEAYK
ncbi:MAG: glucose-1-phosphate thymidylyltransferase [Muribaculaceae bacterium]|nr:glucose-1-phosphate thymidylyltransferase [Muribaculaceae bacterium]